MDIMLAIITILLIIILSPVILMAGFYILAGIILFIVFIFCLIIEAVDGISNSIHGVIKKVKSR